VTFLLSGLWHGASWNYVLWGFYHGILLIVTRARSVTAPAAPHPLWRTLLRIAGMFALTNIGWLIFRETELSAIVRDLTLSPLGVTALDRQVGLYLFLLALLYSVPLWMQSLWVEAARGAPEPPRELSWPRLAWQGVACGFALGAILVLRSRTSLDFIYFQF
jgi:hypothetical protein